MAIDAAVLEVGLAVGRGTGPELAGIFEKVLLDLARLSDMQVTFHRSPRTYHSYHSLFMAGNELQRIRDETMQDAAHHEGFCKSLAAQKVKVMFRTAFTAQLLYLVRQNLEAVKVELCHKKSTHLLLIRDQAQGFYTGSNTYAMDTQAVARTCHFDKAIFDRIIAYALFRAGESWGESTKIKTLTMVYKHHLFDGIFDIWAQEWSQKHGPRILFIQPDTMNRNILEFGLQGHHVIIAGNEYADIMEVLFIKMFDQGVQVINHSENVYLAPSTNRLVEYQTVHGSADDLTDMGVVNPSATLKAAATILEQHGACSGVEAALDHTIKRLAQQHISTPD